MPEAGVKAVPGFSDLVLLPLSDETGQDTQHVAFRNGFDRVGIVSADVVDTVSQRKDPVEDILPAAPVQGDVVGLKPSLKGLNNHEIPVLIEHGLHADAPGLVDQAPVPGQDFLKSCHLLSASNLYNLYLQSELKKAK